MTTSRRLLLLSVLLIASPFLSGATIRPPAIAGSPRGALLLDRVREACAVPVDARQARCLARFRSIRVIHDAGAVDPQGPEGYSPADLRDAYDLPEQGGLGHTIAVVGAFNDPHIEADLNVYRAQFALPACTRANRCFEAVNQDGDAAPLPEPDVGWGIETSIDLEMISATCPQCSLLLVEANTANIPDLAQGVDTAVRLGADVVSNSYGLDEYHGVLQLARHYRHPGVPIVVASGDFGLRAASFPADLRTVIGVGGTRLSRTSSGWQERAWSQAGSGCSAYVTKPDWQHDDHCPMRVVADVSAVADPATGPAFYDSDGFGAADRWMVGGGTSVAAPLIAGMIGLSGHTKHASHTDYLYSHRGGFRDVVGGSNGVCGHDYLCTAKPGYDAPTGIGSPHGLSGLGGG